jgi:hypothetical protein
MRGLTRKELLAGAAAAGVVAGCGSSSDKPAYDPRDWASVKAPVRALEGRAALRRLRARDPPEARARGDRAPPAPAQWLGGPRGTGLVWSSAWERLEPFIPTFHPGSPAANWSERQFQPATSLQLA